VPCPADYRLLHIRIEPSKIRSSLAIIIDSNSTAHATMANANSIIFAYSLFNNIRAFVL
jgi:predicted benzoate:H+ symporter BenE